MICRLYFLFRQVDRKGTSLSGYALHLDRTTAKLHDTGNHGKTDAVTFIAMGGIALIELFKDTRLHLLAHADPSIGDADGTPLRICGQGDADGAAVGGEFDGIPQQIDPDSQEHFLVEAIFDGIQLEQKLDIFIRPILFQQKHGAAQLLVERKGGFIKK